MQSTNSIRQVFISYTDQGKIAAFQLKDLINQRRYTRVEVWEWREKIRGGEDIKDSYTQGVHTSDIFIPIITPNYKDRPGTKDELKQAKDREIYLRDLYGNDYVFIIPFIGEADGSLLYHPDLELGNRRALETVEKVAEAVNENLIKIEQSLSNNQYSFSKWPAPFIDDKGDINALIVIGHSGKEDIPFQSELGDFGRYIPDIEATRHQPQSMRPAEYIPELIYFFNKESIKRQIKNGKTLKQIEPKLLDVYVDWHLLKYYQSYLKSNHLICLGAGDTNLISRWAMAYYQKFLPVHFDDASSSHTIIAKEGGKFETITYKSVKAGQERFAAVLLLLPNPLNEEKVILIAAGLTGLGTQAAMLAISDPKNQIKKNTGYSRYIRIIKGIENEKWRAIGYEVLR